MGKSAETLAEELGTETLVVLHNSARYRDPEDVATDPKEYAYRTARRGETVTVDKATADRWLDLGTAAAPDSEPAAFAKAGMRDPSVLATPPSAAQIAPGDESAAIKAAMSGRTGDPEALKRLTPGQLIQLAGAFAIPVKDDATHAELVDAIVAATATPESQAEFEAAAADVNATDAAKALAAKEKVDLSLVPGTGSGGRIGQPDVVRYIAARSKG